MEHPIGIFWYGPTKVPLFFPPFNSITLTKFTWVCCSFCGYIGAFFFPPHGRLFASSSLAYFVPFLNAIFLMAFPQDILGIVETPLYDCF